jgi:Flp pilus assembly protein TadG
MKTRQRGSIVAMTAILMVALIAILGLAVDFGTAYTARTFAQHAADAGALAGADTYAQYNPATQTMATANAQTAAEQNKVLGQALTATNVTVSFPAAPVGVDRVRVDVSTTIPTFFLRVLGQKWSQVTIGAHAIAEAAPGTTGGTTCLRPLWITMSSLLGGSCTNPTPQPGSQIILWDGGGNGNGGSNGGNGLLCVQKNCTTASQWGLIDPVSLGYPASDLSSWVLSCSSVQVNCGSTMGPKTGATVGDVGHGQPPPIQTLIGQNGIGNNDWAWYPDPSTGTYIPGEYTYVPGTAPNNVFSSSPAVVTMAIWDDCSATGYAPINGTTQTIPISGFAQIFLDQIDPNGNNKRITAQFISMTNACTGNGGGAGGGSNVASGPGAVPVRLIHTDSNPTN